MKAAMKTIYRASVQRTVLVDVHNQTDTESVKTVNESSGHAWNGKTSTVPPRIARKRARLSPSLTCHSAVELSPSGKKPTPDAPTSHILYSSEVTTLTMSDATLDSDTASSTTGSRTLLNLTPPAPQSKTLVDEDATTTSSTGNPPISPSDRFISTRTTIIPPNPPAPPRPLKALPQRTATAQPQAGPSKIQTRRVTKESLRPFGPRHLEYNYNIAHKAYKESIYLSLAQVGYVPAKGTARSAKEKDKNATVSPRSQLGPNAIETLKAIPAIARAAQRLNDADRALEEALARGETWENTPVPVELTWGHPNLQGLEFMRILPEEQVRDETSGKRGASVMPNTRRTRSQAAAAAVAIATVPPTSTGTPKIDEVDSEMANSEECTPSPTTTSSSSSSFTESNPGGKKRKADSLGEDREPVAMARPKRVRRTPRRLQ